MPQRQHLKSALDVGRHSFDVFLNELLEHVKTELLRECNRIAAARELMLRKELNELRRQNHELREGLQQKNQQIAADAPQHISSQELVPAVDLDEIIATDGANISAENSPEEVNWASHTDRAGANTDQITMWGEWKELVDTSSPIETMNRGSESKNLERAGTQELKLAHQSLHTPRSNVSRCMLNPNSNFCLFWDILGIPVLFYDLVMIPMQVFHKPEGVAFDVFGWVLIFYWTMDIFLRAFIIGHITGEGFVELSRKATMKQYFLKSFTFDFLMVAPDWFSKIVGAGGMRNVAILRLLRILRLMRLARMTKMKRLFRNIEDAVDSEYFTVLVSMMLNLLAILGTCHYLGCFWFLLGLVKVDGFPTWVEEHIENESWDYQYVVSLHWAMAQFTPGASRIQACNPLEFAGSIFVLVVGLIFLSLFISALAQARAHLAQITSQADRDNWMLRRYLRQHYVSVDLQVRVMKYVERCLEPMFTRVQRKDAVLMNHLSRPLQLEVQEEQFFHTLIAHPLLKRFRERNMSLTLHLFTNVIIEILLAECDLLFEFGSVAHEMYFVSRGALAYKEPGGSEVDRVRVGSWCTELVLWIEWLHTGAAIATVETHVISLDSAKMRAAVLEHKERNYVARCAHAYVQDLRALMDKGASLTDLTSVTHDSSSAFVKAVIGQ